jgi:protein-tyrosine phosphatase
MDWFSSGNEPRPSRGAVRPRVTEITAYLLIGEYPRPADAQWLRDSHEVTAVLNLQDSADLGLNGLDAIALEAAYADAGIEFVHAPISDGSADALSERLDATLVALKDLIDRGRRVYLHCNAGLNRAPTIAIAYLRAARGMSLDQALAHVKSRHACGPYMTVLEERFGARDRKPHT